MKKFTLFTLFAVVFMLITSFVQSQTPIPKVDAPVYFDVSPPLVDMIPTDTPSRIKSLNKDAEKRDYPFYKYDGPDPVWQKQMGTVNASDGITQNFAGTNCLSSLSPSDDNGDIGPNHYVQTVNSKLQVFSRTGTSLYGPVNINTLFTGIPGGTYNDGDPIVLYDQVADRWLISMFSVGGATKYMMIALSTSGDPTGTYYRWSYSWGTTIPDYPKFGVWRDSYLMGLNCPTYDVAAFNRTQMIAGNASPQVVKFDNPWRPNTAIHCIQPCNNDGTFAPVGSPGLFITINDGATGGSDQLWVYALTVDWASPGSATFTRIHTLGVSSFDGNFGTTWDNIPQPGTTQKLCVLPQILMYRAQYRNFGTHQSIVCCHDVDVNGTDHAGIRWYELRKTGASWSVYQQGTYAPDAHNRWMGSISQNAYGEIALGFSIASSTMYPSIRYTGRVATDPLGTMTFAENTIFNGTQSQTNGNRWGDYSSMSVDPNDDKTFWYTTQYAGGSAWNWYTRIASFKFDLYCEASGGCDEYISRVQLGTIDNVSSCNGYMDYLGLTTDLPLNAVKILTVTNGITSYPADQCGVWIDWNRDHDFNDANETITVTGTPGVGPYTATITPPAGTTVGPVRMRIRIMYTGTLSPCGTSTYGEVEDYTINVTAAATTNTWLGVTSIDWNTGSNWSLGIPPTSTINANIPAGTPFQPVIQSGNANCNNLVLSSGATLAQNANSYFYVYGHFDPAFGQFTMNSTTSYLYFSGTTNNYWYNDLGNDIYTQVRVAKSSPTAQTYMYSDITCSGNFRIDDGILEMAPNKTLTVNNTTTSAFQVMSGATLNLATGKTLTVAGGIIFQDGSQTNITGGTINCGSNFRIASNTSYNIALTAATLNLNGSAEQYIEDLDGGNLQLHHLTINKSAGTVYIANANLDVNGNLLITSGTLSCNNGPSPTATYNIKIAGNWTNNVFPTGFVPGSGRVTFDGPGHQYVYSSENFNILEAKMGAALRVNNAAYTVTCNQYDWTTGAIDVIAGTFTALDLADNGLYGGYYVNPGGTLNITNSTSPTWVDLNGEIHIFGGTMNVSGLISEWPYLGNAVLEMSGGVLDFKTCGIFVSNNAYTLTTNITGGIIRTAYGFSGNRADFTPNAGTFEFYGSSDSDFSQSNGCSLRNVVVNKSSKASSAIPAINPIKSSSERTDITQGDGSKANSITLGSNFSITGNLDIQAGTFDLGSYTCTVGGTTDIEGTLAITQATADLTTHNINWNSGSNDNVTAGTFHVSGIWSFNEGTNAMLGTGNTAYVANMYYPTDADAEFGNLVVVPPTAVKENKSKAVYPIRVAGNFTILSGASWYFIETSDLIVGGNSVIQNGATVSFAPGTDFYGTGNLDLSGTMNLSSGSVATLHGDFTFPSTGILALSSGSSFICDYDVGIGVTALHGRLDMAGTSVFEMSGRSIAIGASFNDDNILGGTIRLGRTLAATFANTFQMNYGTVEFIGSSSSNYIQVTNGNYLWNLTINRTNSIGIYTGTSLTVKNNVLIQSGNLNSNNNSFYVGRDWTTVVGPAGFTEGTGTVYFNGAGALLHQFITGTETFYNIQNTKTGGGYLGFNGTITVSNNFLANGTNIVNGPTLDINNLLLSTGVLGTTTGAPNITVNNFTMGGDLSVVDGNFTCMDVTNNGIFGNITLTNGSITLFQDAAQWPDLNANVTINGGYMAINNGNGASMWGFAAPCNITMNGGVLDFNNNGIYIGNGYPVTHNITGGIIKTDRIYYCDNSTYTPAGGTVEMYAGTEAYVVASNGSHIFNLLINKSGGVKESPGKKDADAFELDVANPSVTSFDGLLSAEPGKRPVFPEITSKANEIINGGVLKVIGATTVNAGTFRLIDYPVTCLGNITINTGGKLYLTEYSSLAIENGKILSVNNGGFLDLTGSAAGSATITHNTGYYALNVENGGTIGAEYGIFEYMNTSGVNIKSGALVDVAKPFNNCTFRLGQSAGRLMTIQNNQTFNIENAVFPTNTWGGTYNVYKSVNVGMVYFVSATGGFAGESYDYDPNNRIMWTNRTLSMKAYLEGPFSGSGMSTTLNPILPLSHPFNPALPYFGNPIPDWYYSGAGSVAAIPSNNIVDWVLVDVRDAISAASATPATSVARIPAFILNNGNIVGLDGSSNIELPVVINNNLFVALYHRNHIGILNANGMSYSSGMYSYDYTIGSAQVFGGTNAHKQLASGVWGMMSGDGDGTGTIQTADKTNVWSIQAGTAGYKAGDYNMNRQVNNPDKDDQWLPNLGKGSFIPE